VERKANKETTEPRVHIGYVEVILSIVWLLSWLGQSWRRINVTYYHIYVPFVIVIMLPIILLSWLIIG